MQYLEQLYYENLFCTHFSDEDIHHLLCGYDEQYENLLLNIYESVLVTSLGCVLADAPVNSLEITPEIQYYLYQHLAGKVHTEIELILGNMKIQINSIADLEDLPLDAELPADQMMILLTSLSPAEIMALMKKYRLAYEMSFTELQDCEKILCEGLYGIVDSLPSEQQVLLKRAVKAFEH